jgi:hypothetical protein
MYSCAQFSGIFAGGLAGGWFASMHSGNAGIFFLKHMQPLWLFCIALWFLWLPVAAGVRFPAMEQQLRN